MIELPFVWFFFHRFTDVSFKFIVYTTRLKITLSSCLSECNQEITHATLQKTHSCSISNSFWQNKLTEAEQMYLHILQSSPKKEFD